MIILQGTERMLQSERVMRQGEKAMLQNGVGENNREMIKKKLCKGHLYTSIILPGRTYITTVYISLIHTTKHIAQSVVTRL